MVQEVVNVVVAAELGPVCPLGIGSMGSCSSDASVHSCLHSVRWWNVWQVVASRGTRIALGENNCLSG